MKLLKKILCAFVFLLIIGIANVKAEPFYEKDTAKHEISVKASSSQIREELENGSINAYKFRYVVDSAIEEALREYHYNNIIYDIVIDGAIDGEKTKIILDDSSDATSNNSLISVGTGDNSYSNVYSWESWNGTITIKNIEFIGADLTQDDINNNRKNMILRFDIPRADIVVDNCKFSKYQKAAIWAADFNSITITNNEFDGSAAINYNDNDDSGLDHSLYVKSSEHISLCLGDIYDTRHSSHTIDKIVIKNNIFTSIHPENIPSEGTAAVKLKIKNKEIVEGVDKIELSNNTFENNTTDLIIGERNPSPGTSYDDSADLNINLSDNVSDNDGSLFIKWVNTDRSGSIANGITGLLEGRTGDFTATIEENSDGTKTIINIDDLKDVLAEYKNDNPDSTAVFKIEEDDYEITFNASDIKSDLTNTVNDLSLSIITDIPKALENEVPKGSIIISSTASGDLPVNKITVKTKVDDFAGKDVELYYYNETTQELELVNTYKADEQGNITFELTHFSQYVLSLKADVADDDQQQGNNAEEVTEGNKTDNSTTEKEETNDKNENISKVGTEETDEKTKDENKTITDVKDKTNEELPKTGDNIMLVALIGIASLAAAGVTIIRIKKHSN